MANVGLLDIVLIALLLGEGDGILLALEVQVGALHGIGRRLPAHQLVLPPVALALDVPVHAPDAALVVARLGCRLGGLEDAVFGRVVRKRRVPVC